MPLSKVSTTISTGGIGRRPLNTDKISGIIFHAASYPSGLNVGAPAKKCYSMTDVVALGITQADATFGVLWYECNEFFRMNPIGELWVGVYPAGTWTFVEVQDFIQVRAAGEIRQFALHANTRASSFLATDIPALQALIDTQNAAGNWCQLIYAPNFSAQVWASATDLRTLTARDVSVIISQDGGAAGNALYVAKSYSVQNYGAALGCLSKAAVNQSIGNPANFNISNGTENEILALANGNLLGSTITDTILGGLKDKAYLVCRKYLPRITGSYFERMPTATISTDDYAWAEVRRAIQKVARRSEAILQPQLQTALLLKTNGQLTDATVGYFRDLVIGELNVMKGNKEISDFDVLIDPTQNVSATSTLVVTVKVIATATAEFITLNIGLTLSI